MGPWPRQPISPTRIRTAPASISRLADAGPTATTKWRERYYRQAWDTVTDATMAHGAAISHHHGIGLNRSRFLPRALGTGFEVLRGLKATFDPNGILNPGKFGLDSPFGPAPWA